MGSPAGIAKPIRGILHDFRVSQRDVKSCLEKFVAAGGRSYEDPEIFVVSGCPKGTEIVLKYLLIGIS